MATETKVEIFSTKRVKPFFPTPHDCRTHKLSPLDQKYPSTYVPMIFFYTSVPNFNTNCLKESLSKTLSHFYPFAGRLRDNFSIDCNDEGAYFREARINCNLLDFLEKPELKLLNNLLPTTGFESSCQLPTKNLILLVQLTLFSSGGIAVAICASHKIADSSSLLSFVQTWSSISCGREVPRPVKFIRSTLFPPSEFPIREDFKAGKIWTSRRLVFEAKKLACFKAKIVSSFEKLNPTDVELVSAIVSKCAICASKSNLQPSVLYQEVNLRKDPNALGNHVWFSPVLFEEDGVGLEDCLLKMRKGLVEFHNEEENRFEGDDNFLLIREILRDPVELFKMGVNMFACTSLCKLPLYEINFRWGNPIWVACPMQIPNLFVMNDTKWGHGIEVFVTLEEQHMAAFERQEEVLHLTCFNPSVTGSYCRL